MDMKITEDPKNYRKHGERNLELIEKSIADCGAGRSIVTDANGVVIGGNGTLRVANKRGIKKKIIHTNGDELVVVVRDDISGDDPRRKTLALADNATSDSSEFDFDALTADFSFDELGEWDIEIPDAEQTITEGETDPDDVPEPEEETVSKRGEVYQCGDHRVMCGDSTSAADVAALMSGDKADMVFTDPPYGVSIGDKNAELNEHQRSGRCVTNIANDTLSPDELYPILVAAMTNCRLNCKDNASYYVSSPQGGELGLMMMMMMKDAGLAVRHMLIWVKSSATFSMGRLDYDYQHEPIFYTWTKSHHCYRGGAYRTTVLHFNKPQKCDLHPTMKPVDLIINFVLDATREGDMVLDLFGGSSPWTKDGTKADLSLNLLARKKALDFIKRNATLSEVFCAISCRIGSPTIRIAISDRAGNELAAYTENVTPQQLIAEFRLREPRFADMCRNGLFKW